MIEGVRILSDLVDQHARTRPDHLALRGEGDALTYRQLAARVQSVAAGLADNGVCAGGTVALVLPNCVEFVISWLALSRIGAVAAPVNTSMLSDGIAAALRTSRAEIAIVD